MEKVASTIPAVPSDLIEPELPANGLKVLEARYLIKDNDGNVVETPREMFWRVAYSVAEAERQYGGDEETVMHWAREFYGIMARMEFLPNSPTLMNAGTELGQLAACYVIPVEDSLDGIFTAIKDAALIHKSGGGTGFSFGRLRPKDSRVGSTGGVASGPVSFMGAFDAATGAVKQGNRRRGANMGILPVTHPDILEFIHCKDTDGTLSNFNISVSLTDSFMQALPSLDSWDTDDGDNYTVHHPASPSTVLNAKSVFNAIVHQAWKTGDPGCVFMDRINDKHLATEIIEATNPCAESALLPWESCVLGSLNLSKFLCSPENSALYIDWIKIDRVTHLAVRFLDNIIDVNKYPLPVIAAQTKKYRKVGLGVMGYADLMLKCGIPYGSDSAIQLAKRIMRGIWRTGSVESFKLGAERGALQCELKHTVLDRICAETGLSGTLRNATVTTIAPTGSLSIIAGCSSGIEPVFALSLKKRVIDTELIEFNSIFKQCLTNSGVECTDERMEELASSQSIQHIDWLPQYIKDIFKTAHDIDLDGHLNTQAAFQEYTDNSVSKTINIPHDATEEDVRRAYILAYQKGCKGITVYRDGCKANQVLTTSKATSKATSKTKSDVVSDVVADNAEVTQPTPVASPSFLTHTTTVYERPHSLQGQTMVMTTGLGKMYVTVTDLEGKPFEVFATIGKCGKSVAAKTEAIAKLVTLALRSGVPVDEVIKKIKNISGEYHTFHKGQTVKSIPDAIAQVLEALYGPKEVNATGAWHCGATFTVPCPECSEAMEPSGGCYVCPHCGYSKCG